MKKAPFLFLILLLFSSAIFSQTLFKNQVNLGFQYWNYTSLQFSLIEKDNGNYIINTGGIATSAILETDSDGAVLWAKSLTDGIGNSALHGSGLIKCDDGGYLLTTGGDSHRFYKLLRFDEDNNLMWSKFIGHGNEKNGAATQTADGGFMLVGHTAVTSFGLTEAFLAKTDSLGTVEWSKKYGTSEYDRAYSVHELENGDFMVMGIQGLDAQVFVMRTDSDGNIIWVKSYGMGGIETEFFSMIRLNDGNFVIRGYDEQPFFNPVLTKITPDGEVLWSKVSETPGHPIIRLNTCRDGGFLGAGQGFSQALGGNRSVISKFDSDGNILWSSNVGDSQGQTRYVGETADGTILSVYEKTMPIDSLVILKISDSGTNCTGNFSEFPLTLTDFPIDTTSVTLMTLGGWSSDDNPVILADLPITEDLECQLTDTDDFEFSNLDMNIFPNPAFDRLTIQFSDDISIQNAVQITVFDANGTLISSKKRDVFNSEFSLNTEGLNSGFYVLKMGIGEQTVYRKFLKM